MSEVKISATASIDRQTWDKVQAVLECHYLTISDALYLLMQNIADEGDLPFSCIIPGPKTIAAMEEAEHGEMVSFDTVEELMAYLNEDDDDDDDEED
ncbi:MAG: type II toxin-antitoxin system RelB/DinJ family antitoxin [Chloroflexota bacterium]|nr:type II toxin-antitoxin system RelB/DinJ family antitoxin [Chloroflexota bacterium]MDE2958672.1 type II toxin-antitoxin system RelB/DinJ family antitoxin [Chloroflexota bacterium]